jgi:hypothetical protein
MHVCADGRIVKRVRTAAIDLDVKHRTPQMGRWHALRAVGSTVRRGLSPVTVNDASQPAAPRGTPLTPCEPPFAGSPPHLTSGPAVSVFWSLMLGGGGEATHVALSTYEG